MNSNSSENLQLFILLSLHVTCVYKYVPITHIQTLLRTYAAVIEERSSFERNASIRRVTKSQRARGSRSCLHNTPQCGENEGVPCTPATLTNVCVYVCRWRRRRRRRVTQRRPWPIQARTDAIALQSGCGALCYGHLMASVKLLCAYYVLLAAIAGPYGVRTDYLGKVTICITCNTNFHNDIRHNVFVS